MPKWLFVTLLITLPILFASIHPILFFVALGGVLIANPIIWKYRKDKYFNGEEFQTLRAQIASVVAEHNEVVNYVAEIRSQGSFELGASSTGQYAHLANFENTSNWNYQRDRNVAEYAPHVHNASLQVVRNASMEPIKYLMKYFHIKADKETLADVQRVAEDISRSRRLSVTCRGARLTLSRASIRPSGFSSATPMSSGISWAYISRRLRCPTRTTSSSTSRQAVTAVRLLTSTWIRRHSTHSQRPSCRRFAGRNPPLVSAHS